jgi:hypothetical protein
MKNSKTSRKNQTLVIPDRAVSSLARMRPVTALYPYIARPRAVIEKKIYFSQASGTATTSGITTSLCNIAQGDDISNRSGRHVRALFLDICINVLLATAGTTESVAVHVFTDIQADSSIQSFSSVFDTSVAAAGQAFYNNMGFSSRFLPLMVRQLDFEVGGRQQHTIRTRLMIPESVSVLEYSASSTTPPDTNCIIFGIGFTVGSTNTTWQINYQLIYDDI